MSDSATSNKRDVLIVPPTHHDVLQVVDQKMKAAGMPAVKESLKHIRDEVGLKDGIKLLNKLNQKEGIDCPGCAWPDPDGKRSKLGEYCENGVKAIAEEATKKRLDADFFKANSVEALSRQTDYKIGRAGRLTQPMVLREGNSHYEPISWEDAFAMIGDELNKCTSPNEAIFYTSGRTSNEAAFMWQLFARTYGTNNLPDCSNMCHESSGSGLSKTVGIGKGSVTLQDLHEAEVIMVVGQNPGTNHPRMLAALKKCKENGGKIIAVNPVNEAGTNAFIDPQDPMEMLTGGTQLTDQFLQVRVNGDVALLKAMMKIMLNREELKPGSVFDHQFIQEHTEGYETLIEHIRAADLDQLVEQSGISLHQIRQATELLIQHEKIIICWAMGLTQHRNGVGNIQEVVNLLLLRGSIGKPGAGTCPVRGHSNVQGDRTMGIWEKPKEPFLKALDDRFGINAPREHGVDVVEAIHHMQHGKAKVFIGMGGNFISATPDSQVTGEAMQNCELTVHVSTKLNRAHLVTGKKALILPCIGRTEKDIQSSGQQFVSVENSMGVVHMSRGIQEPATGQLKSEPAIIAGIAKATVNSNIDWDAMVGNYDVVRDHIEAVIPGFDSYNTRVRQPEGFYLPNGARERKFNTASGKAQFTINEAPVNELADNEFIMMTVRSHDQYNTTIYGLHDRYRGIENERRVVFMHPDDIKAAGLKELALVDIISTYNGVERVAEAFYVIPYNIARRCVGTYFPEANVLIPLSEVAEISNTPMSKYIRVTFKQR